MDVRGGHYVFAGRMEYIAIAAARSWTTTIGVLRGVERAFHAADAKAGRVLWTVRLGCGGGAGDYVLAGRAAVHRGRGGADAVCVRGSVIERPCRVPPPDNVETLNVWSQSDVRAGESKHDSLSTATALPGRTIPRHH